jgi:hypothetical protein
VVVGGDAQDNGDIGPLCIQNIVSAATHSTDTNHTEEIRPTLTCRNCAFRGPPPLPKRPSVHPFPL